MIVSEDPQLLELVNLIKRHPSGDNCQPWEFSWEKDSITIKYNKKRDEHFLNKSGFIFHFGKGFLLETIEDVLEQFTQDYDMDDQGDLISITNIKLIENADYSKSMHSHRFTDRRPYDEGITSRELTEILNKKITVVPKSEMSHEFKDHTVKSEKVIWQNPDALASLMRWLVLSKAEYNKEKEGLLYTQVGLKVFDLPLLRLVKVFPFFFSKLFRTPLYFFIKVKIDAFYTNASFIAYDIPILNEEELVNVSRVILQDWTKLNKRGYSYQPMNISTIPYVDKRFLTKLDDHEDVIKLFQKQFKLDGTAVWMARIGKCNTPYKLDRTLRK